MFPFISAAFISLWNILTVNFPLAFGHFNRYINRTCRCITNHVMYCNDMLLVRQRSVLRLSLFVFPFLYVFLLYFLYSFPNIVRVVKSRRMRWAGHVMRIGEDRGVHRVLVGKPEGKRPLRRPRRRWEDNIKMDLQEVGGVVGTGWCWLWIGTGGGNLWVR
jgi:hypothetical protein